MSEARCDGRASVGAHMSEARCHALEEEGIIPTVQPLLRLGQRQVIGLAVVSMHPPVGANLRELGPFPGRRVTESLE